MHRRRDPRAQHRWRRGVVSAVLEWLTGLPLVALYSALAAAAALENIFPPLPADTVVAFGAFLAARGRGSVMASFLSTWGGNLVGAAIMYGVGRRFGPGFTHRIPGLKDGRSAERIRRLHGKYGLVALFLSRFIPGVRAVVPPFAGALRLPAPRALLIIGLASGIWYGVVTWLAFSVGHSWDSLVARVTSLNRTVGLVAAAVALLGLLMWLVVRRRTRAQ